jgi:hypothetical protein
VNTRNTLNTSGRCGILDCSAIATKADVVFEGATKDDSEEHSVLLIQLSRGSRQSPLAISKDASNPLREYAAVARTEMKIAENWTVFPMSVSLERRATPESVRDSALLSGHCASRAEAATTSTPTYAKVANDKDMLDRGQHTKKNKQSCATYSKAVPQLFAALSSNSVGDAQSVQF